MQRQVLPDTKLQNEHGERRQSQLVKRVCVHLFVEFTYYVPPFSIKVCFGSLDCNWKKLYHMYKCKCIRETLRVCCDPMT